MSTGNNEKFWKTEGTRKTFTHNLYPEWLQEMDRNKTVLDFGCGYGRLIPDLQKFGFGQIQGYDSSTPFIERTRLENPGAEYTDNFDTLDRQKFAMVTCFAVFTCCPGDREQQGIVEKLERVTDSGSILYISDYEMQDNPHYSERYAQRLGGVEGCFVSGEASFRHHEHGHFEKILPDWQLLSERNEAGKTMNGNDITIHQYLFQRR